MPGASAYPVVKQALVARLGARSGLNGVTILDRPPINMEEIRSEGRAEGIYGIDGEVVNVDRVFCAGNLRFDEELTLTWGIEVLGHDSEDTQTVVDNRVNELLYEFEADIADQKDWDFAGLGLNVFDYVYFTPAGGTWAGARLQQTSVFSSAYELRLDVRSRRTFT